jgi:hypothetical protein
VTPFRERVATTTTSSPSTITTSQRITPHLSPSSAGQATVNPPARRFRFPDRMSAFTSARTFAA